MVASSCGWIRSFGVAACAPRLVILVWWCASRRLRLFVGGAATARFDPLPSVCTAGASVLASGRRADARVGRVNVSDVWLQPGTMVVLGSGSAPLLLAGMVLGGARWLALRPVALRPAGHCGSGV